VSSPGPYYAAAAVALLAALWLAFQVIAFALKLLLVVAIVAVGAATFRAWRTPSR
jgi:hypothetical protein